MKARIEGAKRPRIEDKARTDGEERGRTPSSEALTEGEGRSPSSEAKPWPRAKGETRVKAPLRGLLGRQFHPGNAGYPS